MTNPDLVKSSQFSNEGIAESARVQRASLGLPPLSLSHPTDHGQKINPDMAPLDPEKDPA